MPKLSERKDGEQRRRGSPEHISCLAKREDGDGLLERDGGGPGQGPGERIEPTDEVFSQPDLGIVGIARSSSGQTLARRGYGCGALDPAKRVKRPRDAGSNPARANFCYLLVSYRERWVEKGGKLYAAMFVRMSRPVLALWLRSPRHNRRRQPFRGVKG